MGAPKFSPGPFYVYRDEEGNAIAVARMTKGPSGGDVGVSLARMPVPKTIKRQDEEWAEINANAALFASSPDLFEALKDYRQRFYSAVIATGSADAEIATLACARADAALAKALGGK